MPLTDAQQNALPGLRAMFSGGTGSPLGTAQSVDERAREPDPTSVPSDVRIRVEIAPPSPRPHPLLDASGVLKAPERVPLFFYALRDRDGDDGDPVVPDADTRVLFFIHGGGNLVGHPAHHAPFVQLYIQLLRAMASPSGGGAGTKCVLVAPSYRLATVPENIFPAALQDLVAAYDYVLDKGYNASNVVIAGDSAGGNHAVVLTHLVLQSDRPSPHGVIPIAPMAMQAFDRLSEYAKARVSTDVVDVAMSDRAAKAYVGDSGVALTDPLVSGAFIPFTPSWPKTLILVGSGDHMIDGAHELEKRLAALNLPVELVEYDERPHGWWVLPQIFPEDVQDAAERITEFVLH